MDVLARKPLPTTDSLSTKDTHSLKHPKDISDTSHISESIHLILRNYGIFTQIFNFYFACDKQVAFTFDF